jgi:hypothetical protein
MAKPTVRLNVDWSRVVLKVRCGGGNGQCGRIQAVMLEDGALVNRKPGCHRLQSDWEWQALEDRTDVSRAFQRARTEWVYARRSGRPFRAHEVTLRPVARHAREDSGTRLVREEFEAFIESHEDE